MRYNAELTAEGLAQLGLAGIKPENVQALDSIDHITELQRVGQAVGEREVRQDHFDRF